MAGMEAISADTYDMVVLNAMMEVCYLFYFWWMSAVDDSDMPLNFFFFPSMSDFSNKG
jgi:hypothetical protein